MSPSLRARLQVVGAALLFSTGGAAIKATSLNAFEVAGLRSLLAALVLAALLPAVRRGFSWRAAATAVAYAATLSLFVAANKATTAAAAIFLQSTAPLWVLLLSPLLLREEIRRRDLLLMAPVVAGLLLVFLGSGTAARTAPNPMLGNLLATLAGMTWALTVVGLRWMGSDRRASPLPAVVLGNVLVLLLCAPFMRSPLAVSGADWLVVGFLGVFQVGAAYVLLAGGVGAVPALETSLLLLVEPALNPLWAWLVHGERPSPVAVAGGALILGTASVEAWLEARTPPLAAEEEG